jgi:hypothetical protein
MKSSATGSDWARFLVGADVVLDPGDGLDLALDVRAAGVGLGHHVDGLPEVLRHRQAGAVEQHRVPALAQAVAQQHAVRAVVQVQADRDIDAGGHLLPHGEQQVKPDGLHGLDRGLDDHRRPLLDGGGEHRLHGQVVHHVDRRDAVALAERPVHDLLQ